jgi:branched-chain amino acid transport system permease protein
MHAVLVTLIGGLAQAVPLFLVASGLTLIYGVMRILNFAHGAMFMLGAYILDGILGGKAVSEPTFLGAVLLTGVIVGALGLTIEPVVFRTLYKAQPEVTLLASYGLLLVLVGGAPLLWGDQILSQNLPSGFNGTVQAVGITISNYTIVELLIGLVIAVLLTWMLRKTSIGARATALAEDREMAQALGIRANRINLTVFGLGSLLAGVAGALVAPTVSISSTLALAFIIQAFAVVLMGGLGSVGGALIASIILGIIDTAMTTYTPSLAVYSFYIVLGVFVAVRPQGLFGRLAGPRG